VLHVCLFTLAPRRFRHDFRIRTSVNDFRYSITEATAHFLPCDIATLIFNCVV